jgi:hypothetical protein
VNIPKLEAWPIEKVLPYETNVKKHPPEQVQKIAQSIATFGWDQPIVVDKDGVIIKGHGRRLAAISLKMTKVPVLVRDDLSADQVKASRLADNRAAVGDLDMEMLRLEMGNLDISLLNGIFDAKELEFSTADLGEMNTGAFIDDLDKAVGEQTAATEARADALKESRVSLSKAIGFKDIAGKDEIYLNRLMAKLESQSGLTGEAAFMSFVKELVGEVA